LFYCALTNIYNTPYYEHRTSRDKNKPTSFLENRQLASTAHEKNKTREHSYTAYAKKYNFNKNQIKISPYKNEKCISIIEQNAFKKAWENCHLKYFR